MTNVAKLFTYTTLTFLLWMPVTETFAVGQTAPTTAPPAPIGALRAIPEDNLAYPVLISIGNTSGSGFYLVSGKAVFLVTAKHVLFDLTTHQLIGLTANLLSYAKDSADSTKNVVVLDLAALQANKDLQQHPSQDIAVIKMFDLREASAMMFPRAGVKVTSSSKTGFLTVDVKNVKTFDQVLTGNDVMVFGYPTSLGLQQSPQLDPLRPLLRKGIVAGTNPSTRFLILDCPVYFGNSGGPVLEIDRQPFGSQMNIIGVVDQYVPFVQTAGSQTIAMQFATNSGYSLAIPMDYVLELTK
jgi:S1-C subfamily serine protease